MKKITVLIFFTLFFISCSKNNLNENISYIYNKNKNYWQNYPGQALMFMQNNFSKKSLALRKKYLNEDFNSVKAKLLKNHKLIFSEENSNKKIYTFSFNMEELILFVQNGKIIDVYYFDLI